MVRFPNHNSGKHRQIRTVGGTDMDEYSNPLVFLSISDYKKLWEVGMAVPKSTWTRVGNQCHPHIIFCLTIFHFGCHK